MALSFIQYIANGATDTFNIPFAYISKSHIQVKVNGVLDPTVTFPTDSTVKSTTMPPNGVIVEVRRVTPNTTRLVDFADGSLLGEGDLDKSALQVFYVMQEVFDDLANRMAVSSTNVWDALNKKIVNVANGINPNDAVNVSQTVGIVTDAQAAKTAAEAARDTAQNWATKTTGTVDGSEYSAKAYAVGGSVNPPTGHAKDWATKIGSTVDGSEFSAKKYAQDGSASASSAATSSSSASTSATNASTSATNAANSATSAQDWATKTTGTVSGGEYSSKEYAQGTQAGTGGSAKDWAQKTGSTVNGSEFSAKKHAQDAAASATSVNLRTIVSTSGNYTVVLGDRNKLIDYTGTGGHTISLTAATTLASGFEFHIKNSGSGNVTVDPNGAETIDGSTTVTLTPNQAIVVVCTGSNFKVSQARGYGAGTGSVTQVNTGTGLTGGPITNAGTVDLDFNALSTVVPAVGDFLTLVDVSDSNNEKKALLDELLHFFDPAKYVLLIDDFIEGDGDGSHNWSYIVTGSPPSPAVVNLDGNHPGVVVLDTGISSTAGVFRNVGSATIHLGNGEASVEGIIQIPTLSTSVQEYAIFFGFGDANAADPVDGVYFKYDRAVDGDFWSINTSNNSTRTKTVLNPGNPVAAATWYKLRIVVNAAGTSAEFFINGTSVGTLTTNIPTATGRYTGAGLSIKKSVGTTARTVYWDFFKLKITLTTAR